MELEYRYSPSYLLSNDMTSHPLTQSAAGHMLYHHYPCDHLYFDVKLGSGDLSTSAPLLAPTITDTDIDVYIWTLKLPARLAIPESYIYKESHRALGLQVHTKGFKSITF